MKSFLRCLAVSVLFVAAPLAATDLPQGADTLKLLANEADLIAKVTNPAEEALTAPDRPAEPGPKYRTYTATVGEVIKGPEAIGATVRIAIPERLAIESPASIDGALLFLRAASSEQLNSGTLVPGGAIYTLVSGHFGALPGATSELVAAVKAYTVQADAPAGAVSWAARHVRSTNAFLQRSAIMDLYTQRDQNAAFEVLRQVVTSNGVHPDNRSLAIEALEETGKVAAKAPLRSIAESSSEPAELRGAAVRAFAKLPHSGDQLRQWVRSGDPVLRGAAREASSPEAHGTHVPH